MVKPAGDGFLTSEKATPAKAPKAIPIIAPRGIDISPEASGLSRLTGCFRSFSASFISLKIYTADDKKLKAIKPKRLFKKSQAQKSDH